MDCMKGCPQTRGFQSTSTSDLLRRSRCFDMLGVNTSRFLVAGEESSVEEGMAVEIRPFLKTQHKQDVTKTHSRKGRRSEVNHEAKCCSNFLIMGAVYKKHVPGDGRAPDHAKSHRRPKTEDDACIESKLHQKPLKSTDTQVAEKGNGRPSKENITLNEMLQGETALAKRKQHKLSMPCTSSCTSTCYDNGLKMEEPMSADDWSVTEEPKVAQNTFQKLEAQVAEVQNSYRGTIRRSTVQSALQKLEDRAKDAHNGYRSIFQSALRNLEEHVTDVENNNRPRLKGTNVQRKLKEQIRWQTAVIEEEQAVDRADIISAVKEEVG